MLSLGYIEINAFAIVILLIISFNINRWSASLLLEQKVFLAIIISTSVVLGLDSAMWFFNGMPGPLSRGANIAVTALYYILSPLPCILWSFYADYQVYRDKRRLRRLMWPMLIPAAVNVTASILSVFYGYLFYIDQDNIYHRGSLFALMVAACFFYLLYTPLFLIIKRKHVKRNIWLPMLMYSLPPFIGGILQALYFGTSLVWVCTTISILVIFINIQNSQLFIDHLTGLYNRKQLDYYLQEWQKTGKANGMIAGIMADLDSFKSINDQWGHDMGDRALIEAARMLRMGFRKDDLICRYGGDEFVIILKIQDESDLYSTVERFKMYVNRFNALEAAPYSISFSVGYAVYDKSSGMSAQQFLMYIDQLMYEDKKKKLCQRQC